MTGSQFAADLREALGAESAGLWIFFMDKIDATVPFLLRSAGRPRRDEIAASPIGEAGFDSWFSMIEAAPERGGLGWSVDSWKSWKRAYSVVLKHPYLRGLDMTASEINTLARELQPFPSSLEELETAKAERKEKLEAKRGNAVSSLKKQLTESLQSLETMATKLRGVTDERDNCREAYQVLEQAHLELNNRNHKTQGHLEAVTENLKSARESQTELEGEVEDLKVQLASKGREIFKLKGRLDRYAKMTRWEHFKAIFR